MKKINVWLLLGFLVSFVAALAVAYFFNNGIHVLLGTLAAGFIGLLIRDWVKKTS